MFVDYVSTVGHRAARMLQAKCRNIASYHGSKKLSVTSSEL
jgi:hypothetical protein